MMMTRISLLAAATAIACSHHAKGGDGSSSPPPDGWQIDVDMSALDRYVPLGTTTWPIAGKVTSLLPLAGVDVAMAPASVDGAGAFTAQAAAAPGLTIVPIVASDTDAHQRRAHRTLLSARFLAEGAANVDGASVVLTDAVLTAASASLAGDVASVDVAAQILAMPILSQDSRCTTWPTGATQGHATAALSIDRSQIALAITIPGLDVTFDGECQGLVSTIPISGEFSADLQLTTRLAANAPADGSACITSFAHTAPAVNVAGWQFNVWGTGGPLQNWIIDLFSGSKSQQAEQMLAQQTAARGDQLLTQKLADVHVFDRDDMLTLLGRPVTTHLCLGALSSVGGTLVGTIAIAAHGSGTRDAPGAPQIDGAMPQPGANELVLDANVVGQALFSAWRDGGLARANVQQLDIGELELLVPELAKHYADGSTVQVSIDGELPPLVRATPDVTGADVRVELGDLMLYLAVDGDQIFKFGVHLTLDLALVPMAGALAPMVVNTQSTAILLDAKYAGPDDALQEAVQLKIGDAAAQLLSGTTLALPTVPGLGAPTAVAPDAGGRYLHVQLQ